MPNEPYIKQVPGGVITAEANNSVQVMIKDDIQDQIAKAKEAIKKEGVDKAGNADKLENKNIAQLKEEFLKAAEQLVAKRTGYRSYFRRINNKEDTVIEHKLLDYPVVDVYELEPIGDAICSEDGELSQADTPVESKILFYLHHASEWSVSKKLSDGTAASRPIKMTLDPNFSIPFSEMLTHYGITPAGEETLDALETRFWQAFFAQNGEAFSPINDEATCHSPWFDRCCGDRRTYDQLTKAGEWDKLLFHVKPRKTINYQAAATGGTVIITQRSRPVLTQVSQYTFNKIGIKLLDQAISSLPVLIILKV